MSEVLRYSSGMLENRPETQLERDKLHTTIRAGYDNLRPQEPVVSGLNEAQAEDPTITTTIERLHEALATGETEIAKVLSDDEAIELAEGSQKVEGPTVASVENPWTDLKGDVFMSGFIKDAINSFGGGARLDEVTEKIKKKREEKSAAKERKKTAQEVIPVSVPELEKVEEFPPIGKSNLQQEKESPFLDEIDAKFAPEYEKILQREDFPEEITQLGAGEQQFSQRPNLSEEARQILEARRTARMTRKNAFKEWLEKGVSEVKKFFRVEEKKREAFKQVYPNFEVDEDGLPQKLQTETFRRPRLTFQEFLNQPQFSNLDTSAPGWSERLKTAEDLYDSLAPNSVIENYLLEGALLITPKRKKLN
jgi:hypothetical protein